MIAIWERLLFKDGRQWVCSQARRDVLETDVGTGRNLDTYPGGVRLIGVDLSPAMLSLASGRARQLSRDVDLQLGDARALSFASKSFDTVVVTFTLCAVPDVGRGITRVSASTMLRSGWPTRNRVAVH